MVSQATPQYFQNFSHNVSIIILTSFEKIINFS